MAAGRFANFPIGSEMKLPSGSLVLGSHAVFPVDDVTGVCELVADSAAAGWLSGLKAGTDEKEVGGWPGKMVLGKVVDDGGDLLDRLRDRLGGARADPLVDEGATPRAGAGAVLPYAPADVRVLNIDYDDQGERHKE